MKEKRKTLTSAELRKKYPAPKSGLTGCVEGFEYLRQKIADLKEKQTAYMCHIAAYVGEGRGPCVVVSEDDRGIAYVVEHKEGGGIDIQMRDVLR